MAVAGEKWHYITIKNVSRLLSKLNRESNRAYHFCMDCLNDFWTFAARDKHYEYYNSNGYVKVKMPTEEKK